MNITLTQKDRVATITFNRPEVRNAMMRDMWHELLKIVRSVAEDGSIGCVILTGADPAFCAGGDVKAMVERLENGNQASLEEEVAFVREIMESARLLHEMPKPTIAAINGACAGAGFALAMSCDMRLASIDAKFTTAFVNIAASGDFGGSWFLSKVVGTAKARELYYFASVFSGQLAEELGVVNKAFLHEDLMDAANDWAKRLAEGPTTTLGYIKSNMNLAEHGTFAQALDQEALHMVKSFRTQDHKEAATAFVEKRKPNFKGQ